MTRFSLRPAVKADHNAIAIIWYEGASLPGVGPASLPPLVELRRRVDDEFAAGWMATVAEQDGDVVGFLALRPDRAVLDQLFLSPAAIGGGIGKALFAIATESMPNGFTLFTRPGNLRACRFYEARGMIALREEVHPRFRDTIVVYGWQPRFPPTPPACA
jgi:ribosomal protein S18 acetylase RimI-like enzyme